MDIKLLKTDIVTNNIPNFLIFIEREQALSKQYLQSISNTLNKPSKIYNSADAVLYDITTNLKDDYVYIIYNDDKVLKNISYIEELIKTDRNIILIFNDYDKTSNLYKQYKNYFVIFEKLDKYTILSYLIKKCKDANVKVPQEKLETLVEYCDCNLGKCLNEIDKIITLGQDNSNTLMSYMLDNGFSDYRQVNVFKFCNKVLDGDKSAFIDEQRIIDNPVTILYNLYVEAKRRLMQSNNMFYANAMLWSAELLQSIIDGTHSGDYCIKYLMWKLY